MSDSPEDDTAQELLAELGLAVFNAQALEYGMTSLFAASTAVDDPRAATALRQLMDARYAQTLGRLINDAVRNLKLDERTAASLHSALQQRNWLIHHFYRECAPAAFDVALSHNTTARLRQVRAELEQAGDLVHNEVIRRLVAAGHDPQHLEVRAREATEAFIRRHTHE